ncbi:hypothetical protein V2I01_43070 [Micromonospora sp. BRA006-A]|nr:hypothetical protein [Micromonospora sp. BRA006-A]
MQEQRHPLGGGLVPQNSAAPFHPNARGEQGMATALLAHLS